MDEKKVRFKVTKDIRWDNWGRIVVVFCKGDIVEGTIYSDGTISAESTVYPGISDEVDLDSIEII